MTTTNNVTTTNTKTSNPTTKAAGKKTAQRPKATLPAKAAEPKTPDMGKAMNKPTSDIVFREKEFVKEFQKHDNAIRKGFQTASKSFFDIAVNLYWIHKNNAYMTAGKENIYDYARDRFDISRGTTHGYITVVERFGRPALESDMMVIRDEYTAYSPAQLIILAPHTDLEIQNLAIAPTMSCREIKKAFLKAVEDKKDAGKSDKDKISDADKESKETEVEEEPKPSPSAPTPDRNVLITCIGKDDYIAHENAVFDLIHNLLTKKPGAKIEISYYLESEI